MAHGSMMIAQLVGHVFTGEHLFLLLGVVAVSSLLIGRFAKNS